jgi:hypothetical protein
VTGGGAVQTAEEFLAATVETTPDTPAPVLFDQAARARACIAALLATTTALEAQLTQWENTPGR